MNKAMAALEIVFLLFIMIVVTLVVVRLIQTYVNIGPVVKTIDKWDDIQQYNELKTSCKNTCDSYTINNCDLGDAVRFCTQKLEIDINGNKQTKEKNVGNFVVGIPYCEDGMYCFHIQECKCGGQTLTDAECLKVLCNYYTNSKGYTSAEATTLITDLITGLITPGSCTYADYTNSVGKTPKSWWDSAGYNVGCP